MKTTTLNNLAAAATEYLHEYREQEGWGQMPGVAVLGRF